MQKSVLAALTLLAGSAVAPARSQLVTGPTNTLTTTNDCSTASVAQAGIGNQIRIVQTGRGNTTTVVQHGSGNRSVIRQSSTAGTVNHTQEGNACDAITQQSGNAAGQITIRQAP